MVYDPRKGISAKQVFLHVTDAVRNSSGNLSLAGADFTANAFDNFFGAYYGDDVVLATVDYAIVNLGFPSGAAGVNVTPTLNILYGDTNPILTAAFRSVSQHTGAISFRNFLYSTFSGGVAVKHIRLSQELLS